MEKLIQLGEKFGLEGEKLLAFVQEQQKLEEERRREEDERRKEAEEREERKKKEQEEREEKRRQLEEERRKEEEEKEERRRREDEEREARRQERELRKLEMEAQLLKQKEAMEAAKREHELELARLGQEHGLANQVPNREDRAKTPKLPSFVDGRDDLDAYLQRFERFATNAKWEKTGWATKLSALLSGRALDVYSRLSEEAAVDYDQVKLALMKRYDLTEDGYRRKFRVSKPESDESPDQFIVRLSKYLMRWIELSKTTESFEGLRDLIVKEQFINSCPKELAVHLRERAPENLDQIAKIADQYLEAHGRRLFNPVKNEAPEQTDDDESERTLSDSSTVRCFKCNGRGHKSFNCPNVVRRCYLCNKQGHEAHNCKSSGLRPGGQTKISNPVPRDHISAGCLVQSPLVRATKEELESCIRDNQLMLACGKSVPVVSSVCVQPLAEARMPVVKGKVGNTSANVLRDTGCSGVVVKKELVAEDQYTGEYNHMVLIDGTVRKVPVARIYVDTPYLTGIVEAQCLPHAIYDLVIGNVPGARAADNPSHSKETDTNKRSAEAQLKLLKDAAPG